ncbi:hypothetical protein XAXN_17580 [Xanthomonas axonopodis]|uniref:Uncharacterized protein n=1 Tax=Xanthomonas axonopodis TaxID=53413 RepID=A0A0P6VPB1_9XANT|nr:hypothetical protein XAXN_17580 [Xanthomonas axonopodis]
MMKTTAVARTLTCVGDTARLLRFGSIGRRPIRWRMETGAMTIFKRAACGKSIAHRRDGELLQRQQ